MTITTFSGLALRTVASAASAYLKEGHSYCYPGHHQQIALHPGLARGQAARLVDLTAGLVRLKQRPPLIGRADGVLASDWSAEPRQGRRLVGGQRDAR